MHFFDKAKARWISFFGKGDALATPGDFTEDFASILRKARPDLDLEIVGDLELKYGEGSQAVFLHNAYSSYRMDPANRQVILRDMIATQLELLEKSGKPIDVSRIVPVIKDRLWLIEVALQMKQQGMEDCSVPLHEDYNGELIVLFAEDSDHGIRYLTDEQLPKIRAGREDLMDLAIANLQRLLPDIQTLGGDGVFMLRAGGTYEASLLLFNERLWDGRMEVEVDGELVASVPARDVLVVTGSQNPEGLAILKRGISRLVESDAPYRVSEKLFVYRGGKFVVFEE